MKALPEAWDADQVLEENNKELLEAMEYCCDELRQMHEMWHPECLADYPKRCPAREALEKARKVIDKVKRTT